jgi:phosphoesterase RecJ-like protein
MVQIDAASTTEVLYRFFQEVGFDLDADVATCLFAGIINDTDHFSNAATTASAMSVASDLITHGARINAVRAGMLQNKSVSLLKLWGIALARLYFQPTQEAVVTYLFQKDYESYGLTDGEVHGIPNFLNNLGEGRYTLFLKETENGSIKGSLRTTRDDIDVATIAKNFGGGGHKKAAGFTIPGRLVETPQGVRVVSQQQINTATQQHLR